MKCPKCQMELVKKGGVEEDQSKPLAPHKHDETKAPGERKIYVCDVHPEEVFDKPGRCFKDS